MLIRSLLLSATALLLPVAHAAGDAHAKGYWEYRFTDPATNLALLALVIFLLLVWRSGGFRIAAQALDNRAEAIRKELEEARRLRDEAQRKLSDAEQRQREAESEADLIIKRAREDASAMMAQARKELDDRLARRMALAESRIARAEAEAADEVRRTAADAATRAAERLLASNGTGNASFERALADIEAALTRQN